MKVNADVADHDQVHLAVFTCLALALVQSVQHGWAADKVECVSAWR